MVEFLSGLQIFYQNICTFFNFPFYSGESFVTPDIVKDIIIREQFLDKMSFLKKMRWNSKQLGLLNVLKLFPC